MVCNGLVLIRNYEKAKLESLSGGKHEKNIEIHNLNLEMLNSINKGC